MSRSPFKVVYATFAMGSVSMMIFLLMQNVAIGNWGPVPILGIAFCAIYIASITAVSLLFINHCTAPDANQPRCAAIAATIGSIPLVFGNEMANWYVLYAITSVTYCWVIVPIAAWRLDRYLRRPLTVEPATS